MDHPTRTFLGLDPGDCTYDPSRVVLLPVPYDATTSYRPGARFGPDAIIEASTQVELWDVELQRELWRIGLFLAPPLSPSVVGPAQVVDQVRQACEAHLEAGKRVFLLGGEHSVTAGAVGALVQRGLRPPIVLQVDAHLDLRETYEGSPHSHACVARRLLDLGAKVVHVGVRTACPEELEAVRKYDLAPVWAHKVWDEPDGWIDRVLSQLDREVYVSVDVDGLDPSVVPGTGTPVPGGLGWYQLLTLLRRVGQQCEVVGCDLCELAPIAGQPASDFTAALLAYKMVGYFWR